MYVGGWIALLLVEIVESFIDRLEKSMYHPVFVLPSFLSLNNGWTVYCTAWFGRLSRNTLDTL